MASVLLHLFKVHTLIILEDFMLMIASASMALHIPNVVRWTRHMDECLDILGVSDQVLCAQVRLQYILEEFEAQLSSASSPTAVNVTHRVAKRQLAEWASVVRIWNGTCHLFVSTGLVADTRQTH